MGHPLWHNPMGFAAPHDHTKPSPHPRNRQAGQNRTSLPIITAAAARRATLLKCRSTFLPNPPICWQTTAPTCNPGPGKDDQPKQQVHTTASCLICQLSWIRSEKRNQHPCVMRTCTTLLLPPTDPWFQTLAAPFFVYSDPRRVHVRERREHNCKHDVIPS